MAKPKLGSGERFQQLENTLANRPGVTNPAGLAAYIGRKKYGNKKMTQLSEQGRSSNPSSHRAHGIDMPPT